MFCFQVIDSGICGCLDYDLTHGDDYLTVMHSLESVEDTIGGFDADTQRQVVSLLCSGVMSYGENAEVRNEILIQNGHLGWLALQVWADLRPTLEGFVVNQGEARPCWLI